MPQDGRDVSAIANCLCCDSYFVYTIDTIPAGTEFRGRSGKDLFEDLLLKKQEKAGNRRGGWLLPCPTCQEVVHKVPWETFVGNFGLDAVLVVRLVTLSARFPEAAKSDDLTVLRRAPMRTRPQRLVVQFVRTCDTFVLRLSHIIFFLSPVVLFPPPSQYSRPASSRSKPASSRLST